MSTSRKATMAKRSREMGQKDRVKEREERRLERKARADERVAAGLIGPQIGEPPPPLIDEDEKLELPMPTPGAADDRS